VVLTQSLPLPIPPPLPKLPGLPASRCCQPPPHSFDCFRSRYEDADTSEADVESWFNELDANKDGLVDFEECAAALLSLTHFL
jgi:hypothetical protein